MCFFFSQTFKTCFYIAGAMYLLYLVLLILKAYSELRAMPYFGKRALAQTTCNICD